MNDKTLIYYTCNTHATEIDELTRHFLSKINLPIISVSLNKDVDFGDKRIVVSGKPGVLMMHKQIVLGLEACKTKFAYLVENDVLYHHSHFDFTPHRNSIFYFNVNVWKMRWPHNFYVKTDNAQQLSGMCAYTALLSNFFHKRLSQIENQGFDRHYEPKEPRENYLSEVPIICIRHDKNLSISKWKISDFRNKEYARGWTESTSVPGWDMIKFDQLKNEFLRS